ncbi:GerMN domain-containing protein [Paenibacillus sp. J5C_2022]|uniref:GerMN domain-containing protein n=1 Tax=Paenibacillus sp. J5C2022 TaxID=2977129 RepID=UPI0021D04196|nr:GerMN domain-containing protein [Paenibacillus sp. J5C2022]MCU6708291.1 GerMN domain-containing protein [Paenibacillus sp. J5C2022]
MKAKTTISLLLATGLMLAALSGCGAQSKPEDASQGAKPDANAAEGSANDNKQTSDDESKGELQEEAVQEEASQETEVVIYGSDDELLQLTERKATIESEDGQDLIVKAVAELQKDGEDGQLSLWSRIVIKEIQLDDDGAVTIDIHIPDEARLGAPGERLLVDSLLNTLFQFPEVHTIELLVDGEVMESLMGHVELTHPFARP